MKLIPEYCEENSNCRDDLAKFYKITQFPPKIKNRPIRKAFADNVIDADQCLEAGYKEKDEN